MMTALDWKAERASELEARIRIERAILESLVTEHEELLGLHGEVLERRFSYELDPEKVPEQQTRYIQWLFTHFKPLPLAC
jgi:hypothetical protein